MSDSLQPHGLVARQVPLSMEFSRQEYVGVSSHLLLQGTFPTQASNLNLLHLRWIFFFTVYAAREALTLSKIQ